MASSVRLVVFDFDGVFTDNMVLISQDGIESVTCCRSDGLGLSRLKAMGIHMMVVSTERNPVVTTRCEKLGIDVVQGIEDKAVAVVSLCEEKVVSTDSTAFVGNDINDLGAFGVVGYPIAVADAYPEVLAAAKLITSRDGGKGAVREVCDWLYGHHNAADSQMHPA